MAFISACKSWMFKERKNLYFLICCQDILVAFEFAMDFKVDTFLGLSLTFVREGGLGLACCRKIFVIFGNFGCIEDQMP
ncbi:MAG: hypothetical protein PHO08_21020, partial [Methylococcales bacterium]|nr:hypothetical protein [Methylococcales bacterium]